MPYRILSLAMMLLKAFAYLTLASSALAQLPFAYDRVLQASSKLTSHHVANITTMHLSSIATGEGYTTLSHPRYPAHQVRVKKTDFCDPTVKYVPYNSHKCSR